MAASANRRSSKGASGGVVRVFMRAALSKASKATRALAGNLITATLSAVGKQFSETPREPAEIAAYADAMAEMFCAYLRDLGSR